MTKGMPGELGLVLVNRFGRPIHTLEDWRRYAPPKSQKHWKPGRSAMELARAWLTAGDPIVPADVDDLLAQLADAGGFRAELAVAETTTRFDDFRGEPRNHDLVLLGRAGGQRVLVGIEAKVDESFGDTIARRREKAKKTPGSKVPDRIKLLHCGILNRHRAGAADGLRYQLLTAVAGTLVEAALRKVDVAVFLVHEFVTAKWNADKSQKNALDWQMFLEFLPGRPVAAGRPGSLAGPVYVPGSEFVSGDIPLYLGRVVTRVED